MNKQLDKMIKNAARGVTRRAVSLAGLVMSGFLAFSAVAADPTRQTSTVVDPPGDALFPFDLYDGLVPPYLDILRALVSSSRGVFHFELQVNSDIPANASPGLTPLVNHLGVTIGILTDPKATGSP